MVCGPGSGKALRNSSIIYTDRGAIPIAEAKIGDKILIPDGNTSEIIGVWPQRPENLFRLIFEDGREAVASGNHLWTILDRQNSRNKIRPTLALKKVLSSRWGGLEIKIPLHSGISLKNESEGDAYQIGNNLAARLFYSGFLPKQKLLDASITWKRELLAGILDTLPTISTPERVEIYTPSQELSIFIRELCWQLGCKASIKEAQPGNIWPNNYRIDLVDWFNPFKLERKREKWEQISAERAKREYKGKNRRYLGIRSIEKLKSKEPSTCITIADPSGLFITEDSLVTHNSRLLLGVYPTWLIGNDPASSILGISASEGLPFTFMRSVMQIIEHNPHFHKVFPLIRPDKGLGWSLQSGIFVTGRPQGDSKPNYFCAGIDSTQLTGMHASTLIFDDLHDKDNAATPETRKKIVDTYYNTLFHRGVASGTRYILSGRRWAEDDIIGHLSYTTDWTTLVLPAERVGQKELYYDITTPKTHNNIFTEGLAKEVEPSPKEKEKGLRHFRAYYGIDPKGEGFYWPELEAKRNEWNVVKLASPEIAEAVYQCNPGHRSGSVFRPETFSYFSHKTPALSPISLPESLKGYKIIQSWDTSHGKSSQHAYSACITGILVPCSRWHRNENEASIGPAEPHMDVYIVDAFRDKLAIDELLAEIRRRHAFWGASEVCIEEKASGIPALQLLPAAGVPVIAMKAWTNKRARATDIIEGGHISVQGYFALGRIFFWQEAPWLEALETELKNFTGDRSGFKDQVDAIVYLIAQAIKSSIGRAIIPSSISDPAKDLIIKQYSAESHKNDTASLLDFERINLSLNSFQDDEVPYCSTCANLGDNNICRIQHRKVAAIDSCYDWTSKRSSKQTGNLLLPSALSLAGDPRSLI